MKINKILLMLLLSIVISSGASAASDDIRITIDGSFLDTDVAPMIVNDRTLVPMRVIFEALGAEVKWDNDTQTVIGTKGKDVIELRLNEKIATINGNPVILDVAALVKNNRTLVPVRFIVESLGSSVDWDNANRTVVIKYKNNDESLEYTDERYFEFDKYKGEITRYKKDAPKDVVIPETIDGVSVKTIARAVFYEKGLTSIVIPKHLESISESAFANNNLTSVIIPNGVTEIGNHAFGQNKLSSVTIPKNVTSIGHSAFAQNKLTFIIIPENVKKIGDRAFYSNYLFSAALPNGLESIGNESFMYNKLSSVEIPESVSHIGWDAFDYNVNLKDI